MVAMVDLCDVAAFQSLGYGDRRKLDKVSDDGQDTQPLIRSSAGSGGGGGRVGGRRMGAFNAFSLVDYVSDPDRPVPHGRNGGISGAHLVETLELRHVAVWVLLLQTVAACTLTALCSTVVGTLLPVDGKASIRTLLVSGLVGATLLARPVLVSEGSIQRVAPLRRAFKSLRPALVFTLVAWATESLVYSQCDCRCDLGTTPTHHISPLRQSFITCAFLVVVGAGFFRATFPLARSDLSVVLAGLATLAVLAAPQTMRWTEDPLIKHITFAEGITRVARIFFFSLTYAGAVIASLPKRPFSIDVSVICARGLATSVWVLLAEPTVLMACPLHLTLLFTRRAKTDAPEPPVVLGSYRVLDEDEEGGVDAKRNDVHITESRPVAGHPAVAIGQTVTFKIPQERQRELLARMSGGGAKG
jgi:hypothetical protein